MNTPNTLELLKSCGYYMTDGHFRLVSGKHSDTYVQVRLSLMDPEISGAFVPIAEELIRPISPTSLAAFTVGGILLAEALATRLNIPLLVGRKTAKGVEWTQPEKITHDARLIIVDDVLTTASQLNQAIASLENTSLATIVGVLVAVDRSTTPPQLTFRGQSLCLLPCARIPLMLYDPSECPLCRAGIPPKDLSNPETNFISVVLSQPSEKFPFILKGYEKVYNMQEESRLVAEIAAWKPWLPVLLAGLPMTRMEEDSRLIRFVSHLTSAAQEYGVNTRVLSEIVGQLVSLSSVRIESRPIGCSILIGSTDGIGRILESKARVKLPMGVRCEKLTDLVPYFDAFLETAYVLILDRDGGVVNFRRLICSRPRVHAEGIELVRYVTSASDSIGFVLRRGRSAIAAYWKGRLEAVGELSERSGLWEFARPMERIDEIGRIIPKIAALLATVIEVARELVAKGHGGLFIVGDSKRLDYVQPKVEIEPQGLEELSIDDIVELSKLDGAVLIDENGRLTNATVIIRNKDEQDAVVPGRSTHGGSRKETARRTSIECRECAAVYVSQNGAIEIYVRGQSWPVAEAISGLSRG